MKQGFSRRLMVCGSLVVFGFCMLGVKLSIIQIRDRDHLVAYAERQLRRTLVVRPRRGDVVDARGRPLAVSINAPSLFANARVVADPGNTSQALKEILGGSAEEYFEKLSDRRSYVWLKRKINPDQQGKIEKLGIDGLGFVTESRRFYPKRELASSLVGFVGVDDAGMYGVEQSYQEHMGGRVGRIRIQRDAKGRSVHPESRVLVPARPGAHVRLTIDEVLQYIVEKELSAQVRRVGARRAIGVMVEPRSGRILALASVPGFNPNTYKLYGASLWKEPAIQEFYEPGSTFKIVTAAAYLDAGESLSKKYFAENGSYRYGKGRHTLRDHKKYGWLTAEEVIMKSSNIGAFKMARDIGKHQLHFMAQRFGFGRKTRISFPGEARGVLRSPEKWSKTSLAAVAIGQEVGVTPLQMVMAVAAVANGGRMPRPVLHDSIERDGKKTLPAQGTEFRRVLSRPVAERLGALMRKVVAEGTGRRAEIPGYGAAGKTGTAQKVLPGRRGYSRSKFIMSFVGFAPYENPRFALIVIFDEGKAPGGAWGGTVAAPVWRRIAWQALRYMRVPPQGARVLQVADSRPRVRAGADPENGDRTMGEKVLDAARQVRRYLHGDRAQAASWDATR